MSFVNLLQDHRWSERDIVTRMEEMIRARYPVDEENILNRKITGAGLGEYTLSAEEQAEVADYAQVCRDAQLAGRAARADMALLEQVLATEAGELTEPPGDVQELVALRAAARVSEALA